MARVHGAKITALYVVDPYPYVGFGEANPIGFNAYMAAAQEHGAQAHTRVKALCETEGTPVAITSLTVEGVTAYRGIVDTAKTEGVDLIVMGSHGRTGLSRVLLGSVAAKVVADAPVPVLVVR
jgi:nucleotide-binding universal stress UspA family protein